MSILYHNLAERIRGEVSDLDQIIQRASLSWSVARQASPAQFAYVDSVALNLHSFYSGLERLFELIARQVDRHLPDGESWHRDLLQQMSQDWQGVRPAVIGPKNVEAIDELRRFRHLVRNVYTIDLVPDKMISLMETLPKVWPQLRAELLAFADFLEALNTSLSE